jgi:hypothetical protein
MSTDSSGAEIVFFMFNEQPGNVDSARERRGI